VASPRLGGIAGEPRARCDLEPQGRRCEAVADGIRKSGGEAHVIACNISRRDEVEALIAGTTQHYGKVDILVCNAAVNPYYGPLLDITDEAFDKIMGSNVKSNLWLCARAIPADGGAGQGLGDHHLLDRRPARLHRDRRYGISKRRISRCAAASPANGPAGRARQLRGAGPGQDRFRPRLGGKTRSG